VDEIGYLPVTPGGGNLFFQLVNARYEKGAMILTSNRGFAEWGDNRFARSTDPSLSYRGNRKRQLPVQSERRHDKRTKGESKALDHNPSMKT
jgi:DNA replication protein DnaC